MSEVIDTGAGERPAWLDHFERAANGGQFIPSALGGVAAEPASAAAVEPEEAIETEAPAIDADLLAQAFEEGRRSAEIEHAADKAALAALAGALEALRPEPPAALAALLAETVQRLVRDIAGSVAVDPDRLVALAGGAAALLTDELAPSMLFVHPDDLHLLASASLPVGLAGDPALARGSVRLECATGWIEDGPAVRLERLGLALERMGSPE